MKHLSTTIYRIAYIVAVSLVVAAVPDLGRAAETPTPTAVPRVFIPLVVRSASSQPTGTNLTPTQQSFQEQVVNLINQERAQAGCAALVINMRLTTAALGHSEDMALHDYFAHTGSDGSSFDERIEATGYTAGSMAENIAAGYSTPQDVVEGWMNSQGHRANILNCNLHETGVGYYYQADDQGNVQTSSGTDGPYHHYWTQSFATPR